MSDTPQGPGWWQASDGKYYPPEQAPGAEPAADPPPPDPGAEATGGTTPPPAAPAPGAQPTAVPPQPGQPPYMQPEQKKSGCSTPVIILLVVLGVIAAGVIGCFAIVGQGANELVDAIDEEFGEADPGDYEVSLDDCTVDDFDDAEASGTFKNTSDKTQAFTFDVRFTDDNGDLIGENSHFTDSLDPDQTTQWTVGSLDEVTGGLECEIRNVSYTIFD